MSAPPVKFTPPQQKLPEQHPPSPQHIDEPPLPPELESLHSNKNPSGSGSTKDPQRDWDEFLDFIKVDTVWMATNLNRADSVSHDVPGELQITFADGINCSLLRQKENHQQLNEFALKFFKKPLKITFVVPEIDDSLDKNGDISPQKKRQQLLNDPLVLMATEVFNGQVGDVRLSNKNQ